MVRALLLGVLAVTSVPACGSSSDTPKPAANAVAGKVVEVAGKVEATRNGATRPLAVGNEVFADDTIATAADGSIVIELAHNGARWAVEAGQRARVDESVAWGLAKQDTPAKSVEHATSAAGRQAERQGADTKTTVENAPAAAAPAAPAEPPKAEPPAGGGGGGARDEEHEKATRAALDRKAASSKTVTTPNRVEQNRAKQAAPKGDAMLDADDPLASSAPAPASQIGSLLETHRAALARCLGDAPHLTIVVRVAKGTPTFELAAAPASDKRRACVAAELKKITFPKLDGQASIELVK
ncbi:MAG TPA: hypothetical protein VFQ53_11745 [Kofleriaceae bacterium]|nr:hypothetical protein [Kofleriaceae bacterium]